MTYGFTGSCAQVPNISVERMRTDFESMFSANGVNVELIKPRTDRDVTASGDFFGTRERPEHERKIIRLFITAEATNEYRRDRQGIVTNDSRFKAMARWDAPIANNDLIKFLQTPGQECFAVKVGEVFIIEGHNKPFYHGRYAWQEFTLRRVDHDSQYAQAAR